MRLNETGIPTRKHPLYRTWSNMKDRCYNPNNKNYKYYGGRGISVCEEWKESFIKFANDMGNKPSKEYSLERIDVNGNYEPKNCKWATVKEQSFNKRNTLKHNLKEISEKNNIPYITLYTRFITNNISIEDILKPQKHFYIIDNVYYSLTEASKIIKCNIKTLMRKRNESIKNGNTEFKIKGRKIIYVK